MSVGDGLRRLRTERGGRLIDVALAGLLSLGALVQVPTDRPAALVAISYVAALACVTAVGWRWRAPAASVLVSMTGLLVYQLASNDRQMTFEPYAVFLTYYAFGRTTDRLRRPRATAAALLSFGFLALLTAIAHLDTLGVGNVGSAWLFFVLAPTAGGVLVARREKSIRELAVTTVQLRDEQELRAQLVAGEERTGIARDLHDVIAHCVSVMTLQASGARLVLQRDVAAARAALAVVEQSGREALSDLRRIMGVLRREDEPSLRPPPGIAGLADLADHAAAAGLPTALELGDDLHRLPADLQLTVYRIVQEALTNAVKHAGDACARVTVAAGRTTIDVRIVDDGVARGWARPTPSGDGHGLIGMRERVAAYGGRMRAAPGQNGGFEVSATLPIPSPTTPGPTWIRTLRQGRVLDALFAGVWLIVLELEACLSPRRHGPLAVNVAVVGVAGLAVAGRRRYPVAFLVLVGTCALLLHSGLASRQYATVFGIFSVVLPVYTVTAWARRRWIVPALTAWAAGALVVGLVAEASLGGLVGPLIAAALAGVAGRVVRSQRELAAAVALASRRLAEEREARERLAVAGERSRIARELDSLVAHGVTAMVIQAEVAQRQLTASSIVSIETSGREVLDQLRRILGVLRHTGVRKELEPQPGLEQIHALVERFRDHGRLVDFRVEGEPTALLAGVDLVTYRIVEEILDVSDRAPVSIELRFGDLDLELDVSAAPQRDISWPTPTIRERVALYDGHLAVADSAGRLLIRLPRQTQGAMA